MDEIEKMNGEQFKAYMTEVLPKRIGFIKKAAKEGRLIRVEQKSGSQMVKCPECGHSHVEIEEKESKDGKKEFVVGGILAITFVVAGERKAIKG